MGLQHLRTTAGAGLPFFKFHHGSSNPVAAAREPALEEREPDAVNAQGRPSILQTILTAIVAVGLGLITRAVLERFLDIHAPYLGFLPWIVAASYVAGGWGGLLALIGFVIGGAWWLEPTSVVPTRTPLVGLCVFAGGGLVVVGLTTWLNHAAAKAQQAQSAIRRREQQMRLITDALPALMAYVDRDERYLFVSRGYEMWYRRPRHSIVGRTLREILPSDQVYQMLRPHIDAVLAGKTATFCSQVTYPDGQTREVDATYSPDVGADGKVNGFAVLVTDVSERHRTEDALRDSEQRYRALAEAGPDFVWSCAADGTVQYLNPRYVEYTGVTLEQINSGGWQEAVHPDDQAAIERGWAASLETGEPFELEYRFRRRRDGEYRWFLTRTMPVRDENGKVVRWVGAATDIHDSKLAREERGTLLAAERAAREEAERAGRVKDQFLAVLSHELRTPLTPVLMTVSLIEQNPDLPASIREDITSIRRNVELEARLIDDLLDLTRLARGKIRYDFQTIDVHLLIRSALSICCSDGKHQVITDLHAADSYVRGDAARLQQVFWNLLNNAWKFTQPGGKITIESQSHDRKVTIAVSDTGMGIEADVLPRVFDAFEQGDVIRARNFGGLGLGLAICNALVDAHGGTIAAQSEGKDRGATFTVELPTVPAPDPHETKLTPAVPGEGQKRRRLRLLLVEDHPSTLKAVTKLLQSCGHQVDGFASMAEGLRAAEANQYDLLISDLGLPDGSGYELMQQLGSKYDLRGIALSGYGMEDDIERSRSAGFAEHLVKPIDLQTLSGAIERVTLQLTKRWNLQ